MFHSSQPCKWYCNKVGGISYSNLQLKQKNNNNKNNNNKNKNNNINDNNKIILQKQHK